MTKLSSVAGCQLHCFDVGGRMQPVWERYYDDADAIIFVLKLNDNHSNKSSEDDEEEDEDPYDYSKQYELLQQVRATVSDDVPFLVVGHLFGNPVKNQDAYCQQLYSTAPLLRNYFNPLQAFCVANASNGAGVVPALQFLLPLAKRSQAERKQTQAMQQAKELL